jgi:hypothetical protein
MSRELEGDKRLIEAIVPKDFGIGCRRPTVRIFNRIHSALTYLAWKWLLESSYSR